MRKVVGFSNNTGSRANDGVGDEVLQSTLR